MNDLGSAHTLVYAMNSQECRSTQNRNMIIEVHSPKKTPIIALNGKFCKTIQKFRQEITPNSSARFSDNIIFRH